MAWLCFAKITFHVAVQTFKNRCGYSLDMPKNRFGLAVWTKPQSPATPIYPTIIPLTWASLPISPPGPHSLISYSPYILVQIHRSSARLSSVHCLAFFPGLPDLPIWTFLPASCQICLPDLLVFTLVYLELSKAELSFYINCFCVLLLGSLGVLKNIWWLDDIANLCLCVAV